MSRMTFRALAVAAVLALASPAFAADNYPVRDGLGVQRTFAAKLVGGILHPRHLLEGLFGGTPTDVTMTNAGALDVTVVGGIGAVTNAGTFAVQNTAATPAGANTIGTVNLGTLNGAATAANQTTANTSLSSIVTNTTGLATAAAQTTANTSLGSILTGIGAVGDSAWASGSGSEIALLKTIATGILDTTTEAPTKVADGSNVALGAKADTACANDNGTCSELALLKRANQRLSSAITALGSPFQAAGAIGAGEAHVGEVGGHTTIAGASFTTTGTTTALTDGQLLANSGTAGSVTPLSFTVCRVNAGTGMVRRARLKIADTGLAGKILVVKLYRDSPTVTNGDHGTWLSTESNYIGQIPVTLDQHFSDFEKGIGAPATGAEINFDCAGGSQLLYGLIVASGSSGTLQGSKALTVVLETLVN